MKFTREDFRTVDVEVVKQAGFEPEAYYAEIANAKLQEWLSEAPTVYAWKEHYGMTNNWKAEQKDRVKSTVRSHRGKLVCLERLKDE